jgi:phosphoglycolate phosphatase-like HAD superfamily hydrolase
VTRPTVLLFDIDGTLISTGGAGKRAVRRALAAWGDRVKLPPAPAAGEFSYAGMTDRAIVRRGLLESGATPTEELIDELVDLYLDALAAEISRAPDDAFRVLPGVEQVLDACAGRDGVALGLGTGNVARGARLKLEHVGLASRFEFGGYGCDAEDRAELVRTGASRGAARLGTALDACRVVVIGDTYRDVAAARAIGADCVAVATGPESLADLERHGPTFTFADLTDDAALEAILDGR